MSKGKRPTPKSQRQISEEQFTPYNVTDMNGGVLTNPNDSDFDQENRGNDLSFKGDKSKPLTITLTNIDEAVMFYMEHVINPHILQNTTKLKVPVLYGTAERWKQVQKDGFLRDGRSQIMLPIIIFKRTNIKPNRSIANKLDANFPNNYNVFQTSYNKKNEYSNFNLLTNRKPEKEYHAVVVPNYITVTYDFVITTHYVEQMNTIIEAINYASDSYWGDPERFKFMARIDSFINNIELPADGQRIVKTTFSLELNGYIVPETLQKDLNSIKKFNNKTQLIFGLETTQPHESLTDIPNPNFIQASTVYPGNEVCQPVTITENGIFLKYQAAGTTFNYTAGSGSGGNPLNITINSNSFYTQISSSQNIQSLNTLNNEVGMVFSSFWRIGDSEININGDLYNLSPAESVMDIPVINTAGSASGFITGSNFRIRDNYHTFNSILATGSRAETTKSISVIDEFNSDPLGIKEIDNFTNITIRIKNAYVSNSNGLYTQSIIPGVSSSIPNTYINLYNDTGSLIQTGSFASGVTGSFTLSSSIIYIHPPNSGWGTSSFLTGDEGWNEINRPRPTVPLIGIPALLDPNNPRKLLNYNIYGHKHRFVGINGGYYDYDLGTYHLANGTLSDQATVFGTTAGNDSYMWDTHTQMGRKWNIQGSTNFDSHITTIHGLTHAGYSDYFLPSVNQEDSIYSAYDISTSRLSIVPINSNGNSKTSTPISGSETTNHISRGPLSIINRADSISDGAFAVRWHTL